MDLSVFLTRDEFYARAGFSEDYLAYVRKHGLDALAIMGFAGACAVVSVRERAPRLFDLDDDGVRAFLCEAFDVDGETVIDIVGWPLDRPTYVMSMLGRCGLLGLSEAMNPATYALNGVLQMHRAPLDWLKAGCRGAAVVTPTVAARQLLDVPGHIAARDHLHGRELAALARSVVNEQRFIVPSGRAAA